MMAVQPATLMHPSPLSALQVNKNWLVKGRVGSDSASAAVGLRLWHAVSAALTASATYTYATQAVK